MTINVGPSGIGTCRTLRSYLRLIPVRKRGLMPTFVFCASVQDVADTLSQVIANTLLHYLATLGPHVRCAQFDVVMGKLVSELQACS
jgi:hypothetical protein